MGLKEFLTTSQGETVAVKKIYHNKQNHLARQQQELARKVKGSKNYEKQQMGLIPSACGGLVSGGLVNRQPVKQETSRSEYIHCLYFRSPRYTPRR